MGTPPLAGGLNSWALFFFFYLSCEQVYLLAVSRQESRSVRPFQKLQAGSMHRLIHPISPTASSGLLAVLLCSNWCIPASQETEPG